MDQRGSTDTWRTLFKTLQINYYKSSCQHHTQLHSPDLQNLPAVSTSSTLCQITSRCAFTLLTTEHALQFVINLLLSSAPFKPMFFPLTHLRWPFPCQMGTKLTQTRDSRVQGVWLENTILDEPHTAVTRSLTDHRNFSQAPLLCSSSHHFRS